MSLFASQKFFPVSGGTSEQRKKAIQRAALQNVSWVKVQVDEEYGPSRVLYKDLPQRQRKVHPKSAPRQPVESLGDVLDDPLAFLSEIERNELLSVLSGDKFDVEEEDDEKGMETATKLVSILRGGHYSSSEDSSSENGDVEKEEALESSADSDDLEFVEMVDSGSAEKEKSPDNEQISAEDEHAVDSLKRYAETLQLMNEPSGSHKRKPSMESIAFLNKIKLEAVEPPDDRRVSEPRPRRQVSVVSPTLDEIQDGSPSPKTSLKQSPVLNSDDISPIRIRVLSDSPRVRSANNIVQKHRSMTVAQRESMVLQSAERPRVRGARTSSTFSSSSEHPIKSSYLKAALAFGSKASDKKEKDKIRRPRWGSVANRRHTSNVMGSALADIAANRSKGSPPAKEPSPLEQLDAEVSRVTEEFTKWLAHDTKQPGEGDETTTAGNSNADVFGQTVSTAGPESNADKILKQWEPYLIREAVDAPDELLADLETSSSEGSDNEGIVESRTSPRKMVDGGASSRSAKLTARTMPHGDSTTRSFGLQTSSRLDSSRTLRWQYCRPYVPVEYWKGFFDLARRVDSESLSEAEREAALKQMNILMSDVAATHLGRNPDVPRMKRPKKKPVMSKVTMEIKKYQHEMRRRMAAMARAAMGVVLSDSESDNSEESDTERNDGELWDVGGVMPTISQSISEPADDNQPVLVSAEVEAHKAYTQRKRLELRAARAKSKLPKSVIGQQYAQYLAARNLPIPSCLANVPTSEPDGPNLYSVFESSPDTDAGEEVVEEKDESAPSENSDVQ